MESEKLEKILNKINGKPRKILGFILADKRFKEEIEKIVAKLYIDFALLLFFEWTV